MSNNQFIFSIFFKTLLQDSNGNEFEKYVYKVLDFKYDNFKKIDVEGKIGDRKCDGYRMGEGVFYQVYGPKDTNSTNSSIQKYAEEKLIGDFEGLKKHVDEGYWEEIKEYIFVFNNINGLFPNLVEKIKYLQNKYPNIKFKTFDRDQVIRLFNSLNETDMQIIVQSFVPTVDHLILDNLIIKDIVNYLINNKAKKTNIKNIAPDFKEKLEFNKLSDFNCSRLTYANYNVENLNNFLDSYPDNISDNLCQIYSQLYSDAKEKCPDNPDDQLEYLIDNSFDHSFLDNASIQLYETNTLVILSKYFETCDIFEEPKKTDIKSA
ncbi:hypothetical protein P5E70_04560 [Clostridium perfringens]|uniref:ABC-three component system protein n=1 Tax=Clostridium perfringens TaxID=1502 RepID=UPI0024BD21AB|nr:ABC-three component system protein [Clostridium perfringens]MDK0737910.1 hypothetical protein [Clostridium perfringens]CAJ1764209.1 hypothetical protein AUSP0016_00040 [uncultured phage]CAJ1890078.1 hypothetical protein AUSP0015_00040 [uncultured phage]